MINESNQRCIPEHNTKDDKETQSTKSHCFAVSDNNFPPFFYTYEKIKGS